MKKLILAAMLFAGAAGAEPFPGISDPNNNASNFGLGFDGNVSLSSGTVVLVRDMHYNTLTLTGTAKIQTNSFRVFVAQTLDISGAGAYAISYGAAAGNNAVGAVAGVALPAPGTTFYAYTLPAPITGAVSTIGIGGAGGVNVGGGASVGVSVGPIAAYGGAGGVSGFGGVGSPSSGGGPASAQSRNITLNASNTYDYRPAMFPGATLYKQLTAGNLTTITSSPGMFANGAGGGGGDGVNSGGAGGSPGYAGGYAVIAARIINRSASTAVAALSAAGGNGSNGGNGVAGNTGGGGGAAGSGGGILYVGFEYLTGATATNALDASGGNGGNGGNGAGTGLGGLAGSGGNSGQIVVVQIGVSMSQSATNGAAAAPTAPSGATGGLGSAGAAMQGNL